MLSIYTIPEKINRNIYREDCLFDISREYWTDIVAKCFLDSCGHLLYKYPIKKQVKKIYYCWIKSPLYPKKLISVKVNFDEIFFSFKKKRILKVIDKFLIYWTYNFKKCPPKYLHWDCDLHIELGKYIYQDTMEDNLYSSPDDIIVCNSRRICKYFYSELGDLMVQINDIICLVKS